jgi:hypothetical protein
MQYLEVWVTRMHHVPFVFSLGRLCRSFIQHFQKMYICSFHSGFEFAHSFEFPNISSDHAVLLTCQQFSFSLNWLKLDNLI